MQKFKRVPFIKFIPDNNSYGPFMDGRRHYSGIIIRPGAEQYPRQGTGGFTFWRYKDEDVFGDYTLTICGNSATRSINWS